MFLCSAIVTAVFVRWWLRGEEVCCSWSSQTVCSRGAFTSCGGRNPTLVLKRNCFPPTCCRWADYLRIADFPFVPGERAVRNRDLLCRGGVGAGHQRKRRERALRFSPPNRAWCKAQTHAPVERSFCSNFPFSVFYCLSAESNTISAQFFERKVNGERRWLFLCLARMPATSWARLPPVRNTLGKTAQVALTAGKFLPCRVERGFLFKMV